MESRVGETRFVQGPHSRFNRVPAFDFHIEASEQQLGGALNGAAGRQLPPIAVEVSPREDARTIGRLSAGIVSLYLAESWGGFLTMLEHGTAIARCPGLPSETRTEAHAMNRPSTYLLVLGFSLLASPSVLAQQARMSHLDRAKATFRAADPNSDGRLEAQELTRASISSRALQVWDEDSNGELSSDEFLMYYRHLLERTRQVPGAEFEREARRIEQQRAARKVKAQGAGRSPVRPEVAGGREAHTTSTVEKYRRAQQALNQRIKSVGATTRATSEASRELGQRARGVAESESGPDGGGSSEIRARLDRARSVLQGRAQAGGMTREQYEMLNSSLQRRAAASQGPGTQGELPTVAEKYEAARSRLISKAVDVGARRPRVEHTQESLTQRARQVAGSEGQGEFSARELEDVPEEKRKQLQSSLKALLHRARAAGWNAEQLETERRRLLKRAKQAHGDALQLEGDSGEAKAEVRVQPARGSVVRQAAKTKERSRKQLQKSDSREAESQRPPQVENGQRPR